jgi:hypothetical protein
MIDNERVRAIARHMMAETEQFTGAGSQLYTLSFSLKADLGLLSDAEADPEWIEELRSFRNELEVINAIFVESNRRELTPDEIRQVEDILSELRQSLVEY